VSPENWAVRKLLFDAAEALWMLVTAPLKRLIADAVAEAMARDIGPTLCWERQQPSRECSLGPEPEWLRLAPRLKEQP
jgi:hypothetical protein